MYKANVQITLRPSILDPQGKAARAALHNLGASSVETVRIGKFIQLWIDEERAADAQRVAEEACQKLLANPVMEDFAIELERVETQKA